MTKKELQATISLLSAVRTLLSAVRSAVLAIDYYGADYDCTGLKHISDRLKEAITKFRKEAKI